MSRVLVTGGAGFLGSHVARRLHSSDVEVRLLDSAPAPGWAQAIRADYRQADIRDGNAVFEAAKGIDVVVHAAFASPATPATAMWEINVGGMKVLCDAARRAGVARLVMISSTIVQQPRRSVGALRNSPLSRLNNYGASRAEAESVAGSITEAGGELAVVRPKTFLGAGRVGAFAMVFEAIRRGQPVPLAGPGHNRYQLLDVDDLAAGVELLVRKPPEGVFGFGASSYGTVAEDMQTLIDHAGTGSCLRTVPRPLARPALRAIELAGLTPLSEWYQVTARAEDSVVDTSRAQGEIGWAPQKSNSQLLAAAYDWYALQLARGELAPTTHPLPAGHRALLRFVNAVLR